MVPEFEDQVSAPVGGYSRPGICVDTIGSHIRFNVDLSVSARSIFWPDILERSTYHQKYELEPRVALPLHLRISLADPVPPLAQSR
jgi:hypothetical protein